jgi:hypothetical protein
MSIWDSRWYLIVKEFDSHDEEYYWELKEDYLDNENGRKALKDSLYNRYKANWHGGNSFEEEAETHAKIYNAFLKGEFKIIKGMEHTVVPF